MPNLSPGLNARFANIELDASDTSARMLRKQYPATLYSQNHPTFPNTTPSKGPRLSTAVRAQSRTSSSTKIQPPQPVLQKRNLHLAPSKEGDDKHTKYQEKPHSLSFMRETLSFRKKQASFAPPDAVSEPTRSSSHSDISTRRPHPCAALAQKKRQISKAVDPSTVTERRFEPLLKVPFGDKLTLFTSYSPSNNASAGHLPRPKEDVYTRLSLSSKKAKQREEPLHKRTPAFHQKQGNPRVSSHAQVLPHPAVSRDKPSTVQEMYRLIYRADRGFFTASNSLDLSLVAGDLIPAAQLLNSQEGRHLSVYERGEIMRSSGVYYVPHTWREYMPAADINVSSFKNNYGFDDPEGNYIIRPQDHIEYRYEIVRVLGTGSFGNVVHCKDHKYSQRGQHRNVAIKLIKNELDWPLQAVSEMKMLKHLMAALHGKTNDYIMNYCDHFHFRGHMCIVSEVLLLNFYTLLELGSFKGVSLSLVKNFAYKILKGLEFVHEQKVIHCDIKPENIMIRLPLNYRPGGTDIDGFDVKLIDFGSSCFASEASFSYIQSRFYRAPEVILGSKYSYAIDMWSFGCVVAELFTASPLLPGKNELEQVALILEMFGAPPSAFILSERKRFLRFMKTGMRRNLNDPLVSDAALYSSKPIVQVDERKLRKTLLYTLFNTEGKINLQFLNLQLQAMESKEHQQYSTPRRSVKISARSLDVSLRLHNAHEEKSEQANFSRFMGLIFKWNPAARPTASELLTTAFLQDYS